VALLLTSYSSASALHLIAFNFAIKRLLLRASKDYSALLLTGMTDNHPSHARDCCTRSTGLAAQYSTITANQGTPWLH
jgi:hypothetical protein